MDMFVDVKLVGIAHGFECLCWNTRQSCCLSILEPFHCTSEFFPGDGVIEFPHGTLLWDMFKNCRIRGAVIVEDIVEMRSEDFHVLGGTGRLVS